MEQNYTLLTRVNPSQCLTSLVGQVSDIAPLVPRVLLHQTTPSLYFVKFQVEIGDPPSDGSANPSSVAPDAKLSVDSLKAMSSNLSEMAQDGSLSNVLNASVVGVAVSHK